MSSADARVPARAALPYGREAALIDGTASSTANSSNEVGFRWTNAVVLDPLAGLSSSKKTGGQERAPDLLRGELLLPGTRR
jgi:hypothetical protein